jgi:Pyruvate/2-oxoacid:ferredoxin oxidoreductase delta subunit
LNTMYALGLPEDHPLRVAHKRSSNHRAEIESSQLCGCFYCLGIFGPDNIVDWTDESNPHSQQTALCPVCGIDSVIGDASGIKITPTFLETMRTLWFG